MIEITTFLAKVRNDIRATGVSYVYYDGDKVYSRRDNRKKRPEQTQIGVFRRYDTDADILDQCSTQIEAYNQRKAKQGERFAKALGL